MRRSTMTSGKLRLSAAATVSTTVAIVGMMSVAPISGDGSGMSPVDPLACDMSRYKAGQGPAATLDQNVLTVSWPGQNGSEMRARYAVEGGQPIVRELS